MRSTPWGLYFEGNVDEYELEINKFMQLPDLANLDIFRENIKTIFSNLFEGLTSTKNSSTYSRSNFLSYCDIPIALAILPRHATLKICFSKNSYRCNF